MDVEKKEGTDQLCGYCGQLICAFVFQYSKIRFSQDTAQIQHYQYVP